VNECVDGTARPGRIIRNTSPRLCFRH